MKKLMLVLFVLGITLSSFAGLKEKDVLGTWKFKVETPEGDVTGTLNFEKKEGKLFGEVNTDDGENLAFRQVELRENNLLYCELDNGYEIFEISLTVKSKTMEGTVDTEGGIFPMTCEKVE